MFVRASISDDQGTVISDNSRSVKFSLEGDAKLIGDNPFKAEAGIASILMQAGISPGKIKVTAKSEGVASAEIEIISK
jgi:beta-galactosidase